MAVTAGQTWHSTLTGQSGVVERAGSLVFIRLSDGTIQCYFDTTFPALWTQATSSITPNDVWSSLTVMQVVNPMDHGCVGNGYADDTDALDATLNVLSYDNGGLIYFPNGRSFRKIHTWNMDHGHVKFWAPNGQASIRNDCQGLVSKSSIAWHNVTGVCVAGLVIQGWDAFRNDDTPNDSCLVFDRVTTVETIGVHIIAGPDAGIFHLTSADVYNEHNWVQNTWSDHIHHTGGTTNGWTWGNFCTNAPTPGSDTGPRGDDGVAAVTYGPGSPSNTDLEWWNNSVIDQNWGRAYSVIGGKRIHIHHNFAKHAAGAGVIVASESSFNSDTSDSISIDHCYAYDCGTVIGHPSFLVSGDNSAAPPLSNISFDSCVSAVDLNGDFRVEGLVTPPTPNTNFSTNLQDMPVVPVVGNAHVGDTSVLRTRDTFHVPGAFRTGCYRIHVRTLDDGVTFQQRFEYIFKGTASNVGSVVNTLVSAGHYLSRVQAVGSISYALVLTSAPIGIGSGVSAVSHIEMRAGDNSGALSWLWSVVDAGNY